MSFSIIAVVGKNRELGRDGKLIWHLPEDLAFFKKTTMGHPVLMGRKTFDSLPSMLPGRKHYVVTRSRDFVRDGVEVVDDLEQFAESTHNDEIFVIGGGQIYNAMLPYADTLYLTEVDADDEQADTFFPKFDKAKYNREILGKGDKDGISYTFAKYTKK